MERVGVYLRISADPDGSQSATGRQREDCQRYAASHGWEVADVFEDVDLSAYKRGVKRPEFERMLESVAQRSIEGVLCWKMDRISRRMRDLVRLDEACEEAKGFIATVVEGIDTRQSTGRFIAELLVAQARMESENTSTRVKRAHEEKARKGRPVVGGFRPFGYTADMMTIMDEEAELIREAARRILAGESLRGICLDWERRGVKSPAGKPLTPTPLRRMLMSGTLSAQREYEGTVTKGTWPAILSTDETVRLRAILGNPARLTHNGTGRKYLLTGILRCGRCGHPMVGRRREDRRRRYICDARPGKGNCGRMCRVADKVEGIVKEAVFAALDGADVAAYMKHSARETDAAIIDAISRDEGALETLGADYYVNASISRTQFFSAQKTLTARLERNRARLAQSRGETMAAQVVGAGEEVRRVWDEKPLSWQQAVISAVIDHIDILPAKRRGKVFDPTLVEPIWRA